MHLVDQISPINTENDMCYKNTQNTSASFKNPEYRAIIHQICLAILLLPLIRIQIVLQKHTYQSNSDKYVSTLIQTARRQ